MLSAQYPEGVLTSAIAERMETKASSVTEMIKKLTDKKKNKIKQYVMKLFLK